ncbi:COX15/CtaA family protein [Bernardetia sp. ABR2-2B]|uniref:COX15/CtaA family protein n=1 Tax=Bernardetia sp. ABR2-2B TaxID=3127472 RepID=UPI0030D079C2
MAAIYRKFGITTIIAVYLLILVGGIVRSTGSGMGCPDWPKCFGQYVPPTDISELPEDYKTIFAVQGREIADFNAVHTWIEYINRLLGALIGLFILITAVLSVSFWKKDKIITLLSILALIGVLIQGWLGAKVVSSDLHEGMITIHMIMALVIVGLLIYTIVRSYKDKDYSELDFGTVFNSKKINLILFASVGVAFVQLILGTQVRESIDTIAKTLGENLRSEWIDNLGMTFYIHRSFSILVLLLHLGLVYMIWKNVASNTPISKLGKSLLFIIIIEVITGTIMAYFAIPKPLQPVHMLLASVALGVHILLILFINFDLLIRNKEIVAALRLRQEEWFEHVSKSRAYIKVINDKDDKK